MSYHGAKSAYAPSRNYLIDGNELLDSSCLDLTPAIAQIQSHRVHGCGMDGKRMYRDRIHGTMNRTTLRFEMSNLHEKSTKRRNVTYRGYSSGSRLDNTWRGDSTRTLRSRMRGYEVAQSTVAKSSSQTMAESRSAGVAWIP